VFDSPRTETQLGVDTRPRALRAGDLVAMIALSGGLEQSEASLFARGVKAIEEMVDADAVSPAEPAVTTSPVA
jgi:hypothetical protein